MPSTSSSLLEWITAIGAVATPVILALFTGLGWAFKRRIEKNQKIEEDLRERAHMLEAELREDRLEVYNEILEPFVILLTKDEGFAKDKTYRGKTKEQIANEKMLSVSYRQAAFKLSLFGSDSVVKAYNDLMQFFYMQGNQQVQDSDSNSSRGFQMLIYFGNLLLEIRKSVGNESTILTNIEMLEWLITDVRRLKAQYGDK